MGKIKLFFVKNRIIIIIASILLICAIAVAAAVYAQVTHKKIINYKEDEERKNNEELEKEFNQIFTNSINIVSTQNQNMNYDEIINLAYDIEKEETNYSIKAKVPLFKIGNEETKKINEEIQKTFIKTIINIATKANTYSTFDMDYVIYVNNDILSLIINCKYKDGSNPQRRIIQTYNYNIKTKKLVSIDEMLEYNSLNKEDVQNKIKNRIKEENKQSKTMNEQGLNVYLRDENDDMYKIENTPNYFLGKDGRLYLIYAYGNNNFTSEFDLIAL